MITVIAIACVLLSFFAYLVYLAARIGEEAQ